MSLDAGVAVTTAVAAAITAVATICIAWFTRTLQRATKSAAEHVLRIERAYVKMSHPPPGISFDGGTGRLFINMGIKNFGNTPANVTNFVLAPIVGDELPERPNYPKPQSPTAKSFLVKDDEVFLRQELTISVGEEQDVRSGSKKLWIIGYVDYIDGFGVRHRGGYARLYWPEADNRSGYATEDEFRRRNNLIFVPQSGWNYDRLRRKSEGDDWER